MRNCYNNPTESAAIRNIERERRRAERRESVKPVTSAQPVQKPVPCKANASGEPVYRRVVFDRDGNVVSDNKVMLREKKTVA